MRRPYALRFTIAAVVLNFFCTNAGLAETENRIQNLRGIKEVSVSALLSVPPHASRYMQLQQRLQTITELALRQSGLIVTPSSTSRVCVHVRLVPLSNGTYFFSSEVEMDEPVMVERNKHWLSEAVVWHTGSYGFHSDDGTFGEMFTRVKSGLDEFANDWLRMNPRQ